MKKPSSSLLDLAKSPVLNAALAQLDAFLDTINKYHKIDPVSLESLISRFDEDTDRVIREISASEGITFVGGHVIANALTEDSEMFLIQLKLYFATPDGKYVLKDSLRRIPYLLLDDLSRDEIRRKEEIKFEVTDPSRS